MNLFENEFLEIISEIDLELASNNKTIPSRPVEAMIEIFNKYKSSGILCGRGDTTELSFPVTPSNLSEHVENWYNLNYGDAIKVDLTVVKFPLKIHGSFFSCQIPLVLGQCSIVSARDKLDNGFLNTIDHIINLPQVARKNLKDTELNKIQQMFHIVFVVSNKLSSFKDPLLQSAKSDILASCSLLTIREQNSSLSAWHSLQFAEKLLKFFISKHCEPKKVHSIKKLKNQAVSHYFIEDENINWDLFNFTADVRYNPSLIAPDKALEINHEAWKIGWNVLHQPFLKH